VSKNFPPIGGVGGATLGVDRYNNTLSTKSLGSGRDKIGIVNCSRIDTHLIGSGHEHLPHIFDLTNSTADRDWHKTAFRCFTDDVDHSLTLIRGCRYVEKDEFIGSLAIVFDRTIDRITGVSKIYKICAFHDTTVGYVETGDDSLGQHGATIAVALQLSSGLRGWTRKKFNILYKSSGI
jgi:hypothetical protein